MSLFQQCKDSWKEIAVINYPWSTKTNIPNLTGIPPHVVLMSKLHKISNIIKNFKNDFRDILKSELDDQNIGSNIFAAQRIIGEIEKLGTR